MKIDWSRDSTHINLRYHIKGGSKNANQWVILSEFNDQSTSPWLHAKHQISTTCLFHRVFRKWLARISVNGLAKKAEYTNMRSEKKLKLVPTRSPKSHISNIYIKLALCIEYVPIYIYTCLNRFKPRVGENSILPTADITSKHLRSGLTSCTRCETGRYQDAKGQTTCKVHLVRREFGEINANQPGFLMEIWWNNHFSCDFESSDWNNC